MSNTMKTTHGILSTISSVFTLAKSDGTFINFDEPVRTLDKLYDSAIDNRLTHLWIHQNCRIEILQPAGAEFNFLYTWKYDERMAKRKKENPLISCYGRRISRLYEYMQPAPPPRKSWNVYIILLQHVLWDGFAEMTPQALLAHICTLESRLGVQMSGSPSGTGLRYLRKLYVARPHMLERPKTDLAALPWGECANPVIWDRDLTSEELEENHYLIAVDKNGAFPRAAQEENFGWSEPTHTEMPGGWKYDAGNMSILDLKKPGMYHLMDWQSGEGILGQLMNKNLIPSPIWDSWRSGWLAAPIIKMMLKSGCNITIDESWLFENHAPIFKKWVEQLWEQRQAEEEGSLMRKSYKQLMNDLLGLTRSKKFAESAIARPDYNAQVVGGSRANMLYNVYKYARDKYYPWAVEIDALYYLSKFKDPNMAIPGITAHNHSLGGYKVKWVLPLDAAVKNVLVANLAFSEKLHQLNLMAAKSEYEVSWALESERVR